MEFFFNLPPGDFPTDDPFWTYTATPNSNAWVLGGSLWLNVNAGASNEIPKVTPAIVLTGDFEVYASFSNFYGQVHASGPYLSITSVTDPTSEAYVKAYHSVSQKWASQAAIAGTWDSLVSVARIVTDAMGRFRITRSGSTLTTSYFRIFGSTWTTISATHNFVDHNVTVSLGFDAGTSTTALYRFCCYDSLFVSDAHIASGLKTISGTVSEAGTGVARDVLVYNRDNGELIAKTTSAANGAFTINTLYGADQVFAVALDNEAGLYYNAKIFDWITPGAV